MASQDLPSQIHCWSTWVQNREKFQKLTTDSGGSIIARGEIVGPELLLKELVEHKRRWEIYSSSAFGQYQRLRQNTNSGSVDDTLAPGAQRR
jgi:hypothetical protein